MIETLPVKKSFEINGFCSAFNFSWDKNFVFNGERHDFWEIVFIESGEVEITEDENIYTVGAGKIIFHAPMEFHRIKSSSGSCPSGCVLSFRSSGDVPKSLRDGVFSLGYDEIEEYERIAKLAVRFINSPADTDAGEEAALLLCAFMIRLGAKPRAESRSATQSASEYRRIVSYMIKNVEKNLTVSDIAKETSVSVSYIKLLFSTFAGISPKNFFNDLRIRRAALLLTSGLSVTDVANEMSFSSPSYFCSFYKKHTGTPPARQRSGKNG